VKIPSVQAIAASAIMLGAMIAVPITTAGPAAAAGTIPAGQQSCSAGQPKLDYEYANLTTRVSTWSNVCGTGTWNFNQSGNYELLAIRMPTTPTHRVWLYAYGPYAGDSVCAWSPNTDVYVYYLTNPGSELYQLWTGQIQVSTSTAKC
jgi:hypothetical protein